MAAAASAASRLRLAAISRANFFTSTLICPSVLGALFDAFAFAFVFTFPAEIDASPSLDCFGRRPRRRRCCCGCCSSSVDAFVAFGFIFFCLRITVFSVVAVDDGRFAVISSII